MEKQRIADGRWFDRSTAQMFEAKEVDVAVDVGQRLYRTKGGNWVLYDETEDAWAEISHSEAARWLAVRGYTSEHFDDVMEIK